MKKFAGNKPLAQIRAQCKALKLKLDDRLYRTVGHDHISIRGGGGIVVYSTFNGCFFGTTDKGVQFDSSSTEHENEPWFQQLLNFFYIQKEPAHA